MLLGLFIANFGNTVANFAGWRASMQILGFSKYVMVPIGAIAIWILVCERELSYPRNVLLVACLIFVGYIISGFMAKPDWAEVGKR